MLRVLIFHKFAYGFLFVALLPAALILWAQAVTPVVGLPAPHWASVGWLIAIGGILLMAEAMRELWVHGGGLPMNAFPPPRLVATGIYALVPHPIYCGFCATCLGVSLATGSPGGLWLVTPSVMLACVALVIGYEGPALRARFTSALSPLLRPPGKGAGPPTVRDRFVVYPLLFLPWLILYEAWGHAQPEQAWSVFLPGETHWPVQEWTTYVYSLAYPLVLVVPLVARSRDVLRDFFLTSVVTTCAMMLLYLVIPVRSPPRPFDVDAIGGWLLALERADGLDGAVAFPAFHVVWAFLAARTLSSNGKLCAAVSWTCAVAIGVACVTTGMHAAADVAAAILAFAIAANWRHIWRGALHLGERIANSWACLRIGPFRVINYAAYAGLAAACGFSIAAMLSGEPILVFLVAAVALLCAGLWGQALTGSRTLLRPFGYFGALLGAALGLMLVSFLHARSFWPVAASIAVAAPWIVAIGRLRCLVQGCCHGRPIHNPDWGIRYRHPQSRVCRIAHLDGVSVHPTPLYSIAFNAVIGMLLARLWFAAAPLSLIVGAYLLLAGITRFIEESTRGEPQTQVLCGLPIYHWLAIASTISGAALTAVPSPVSVATISAQWAIVPWALACGAAFALAMGVDLPGSSRRFSRLV
jgi:protein-S-isoprenylcysteine O-methyltransferase Ste14